LISASSLAAAPNLHFALKKLRGRGLAPPTLEKLKEYLETFFSTFTKPDPADLRSIH